MYKQANKILTIISIFLAANSFGATELPINESNCMQAKYMTKGFAEAVAREAKSSYASVNLIATGWYDGMCQAKVDTANGIKQCYVTMLLRDNEGDIIMHTPMSVYCPF
jgi:hypothetical protein